MLKNTRKVAGALFGIAALGAAALAVAGHNLVAPSPRAIPEEALGLGHEAVTFPSESGSTIHGWYVPGSGAGTVVLLHGIRGSRLRMVKRAEFLHQAGYSVLLFDFQAHGQSPGEHITHGYLEALDAEAAVAYAGHRNPGQFLAAIGVSMGAAAAVLGPRPLPVHALVLEAVYFDIGAVTRHRLARRVGPLAPLFAPLVLAQLKPRLGIGVDDLSPKDKIKAITAPLLMIAGSADWLATMEDTEALFAAAPSPKSLWVIPGASHVDFSRHYPGEYRTRVLSFLAQQRSGGVK
jgi:fermentation-respiration switch protein FrsA (DUF1100 family)